MKPRATLLLHGARELLTCSGTLPATASKADFDPAPLGIVENGAIAVNGTTVVAIGKTGEIERTISLAKGAMICDVGDAIICPGFVDSHTHALFAGDRAHEYSLRVQGAAYAEIAAAGGGIASTVDSVRRTANSDLQRWLTKRIHAMAAFGTTTVEVKTGYALDVAHELRCLEILGSMGDHVVPTWLGLHAVPPEFRGSATGRRRYLEIAAGPMLDAVVEQGIARFVDAYIDGPGFSVEECRPTLERARALGLRPRLHVGQFEDVGGAEFAASVGAASADHLEHVSDDGLRAMAAAGVVGTLLPGAAFTLGQPMPDARRLRALGVRVALGTDLNPGTSQCDSLPLMASFAVRQMGLSTVEAWLAITAIAADSLGLPDRGRLTVGGRADLAVLDLASWEALPAVFGSPRARLVVRGGEVHWFGRLPL